MTAQHHEIPAAGEPPAKTDGAASLAGTSIDQLVADVRRLANYAIRTGQLPKAVDIQIVYLAERALEQRQALSPELFAGLVNAYQVLERHFPAVTADSLAATEPEQPGKIRTSPTGRYLLKLWACTGFIVLAILLVNLSQFLHTRGQSPVPGLAGDGQALAIGYRTLEYLEPFFYGALGAFIYILRVTEQRLQTREFDPARAPEHVNRLVLGTLAGGSIILFIKELPNGDGSSVQISSAALGFLAGYSVDFLFQVLDRLIGAILPKVGLETIERRARRRHEQDMIRRYQTMLDETQDEATKKLLGEIIDDLRRQ